METWIPQNLWKMHFLSIHIHYKEEQLSTYSMKIRIPQILWKIYFPSILLHINVSFHKLYGNLNSTEFVENVLLMENIFPQIQWKTVFHCYVDKLMKSTKKVSMNRWIHSFTLPNTFNVSCGSGWSLSWMMSQIPDIEKVAITSIKLDSSCIGWCSQKSAGRSATWVSITNL